jgi:hypothetical protein
MDPMRNPFLIAGGLASAIAAVLHLGCIAFGAPWYRFFGAGEQMAQLAEAGSWTPTFVTLGIAGVLASWSAFALSAGGVGPRLPFARLVVWLVTAIYLLRGLAVFVLVDLGLGRSTAFWWWSSGICVAIGVVHLAGLVWKPIGSSEEPSRPVIVRNR